MNGQKKAEKCQTFQRVCTALGCILQRKIVKNQTDANFSSTSAMYEVTVCEAFALFHQPTPLPLAGPRAVVLKREMGKKNQIIFADFGLKNTVPLRHEFPPLQRLSCFGSRLNQVGSVGCECRNTKQMQLQKERRKKNIQNNTRGIWGKKELSIFHRGMNYFSRVTNHFCQCQSGRFLFRTITGVHTCHWVGSYYILTLDVHPFPACTVVCFTVRKGEVSLV